MALVDIQVPDIGDFDEVGVIEVLVKAGDQIKAEQAASRQAANTQMLMYAGLGLGALYLLSRAARR